MALNPRAKSSFIWLWTGLGCLSLGLGWAYIARGFNAVNAVAAVSGTLALLLFARRITDLSPKALLRPPWKERALLMSAGAGTLVIFLLVNFLAFNLHWRWDLTKIKQHTLTENTTTVLQALKQDVKLTAFYVGLPPKYLNDLFAEMERVSSGRIQTEIIDPIVQIGYAARFDTKIRGDESKVIVRSGGKGGERKDVDFTERPLSEGRLTNAIISVTRKKRIFYFLTGHAEYSISEKGGTGLSRLVELLSGNNVTSKKLMLGTQAGIPEDCAVLIVAGPHDPLTKKEESLIRTYLEKGGDALFLIEHTLITTPDKPLTRREKLRNPSLNGLLADWGIRIGADIVVDLNSHIGSDVGIPATRNYPPHKAIIKGLDYTFFVRPRSISVLPDRRKTLKLAPMVLTASKKASWGETDRTLRIKFDPGIDFPGPVPIAFAVFEPKEEGELSDTRIIIFTDADFLTDALIDQYSNARLGLNALNWLSEMDIPASIDERVISVSRLDLTSTQKRGVAVLLFLIPFLIAACGISVLARRHP